MSRHACDSQPCRDAVTTNDPADGVFHRGLEAYRAGRHFEAHEHWEDLWRCERDPDRREFLQGMVQIAAAMHKLLRMRNPTSAQRILVRALRHVAAGDRTLWGFDRAAVVREIERALAVIQTIHATEHTDTNAVLVTL